MNDSASAGPIDATPTVSALIDPGQHTPHRGPGRPKRSCQLKVPPVSVLLKRGRKPRASSSDTSRDQSTTPQSDATTSYELPPKRSRGWMRNPEPPGVDNSVSQARNVTSEGERSLVTALPERLRQKLIAQRKQKRENPWIRKRRKKMKKTPRSQQSVLKKRKRLIRRVKMPSPFKEKVGRPATRPDALLQKSSLSKLSISLQMHQLHDGEIDVSSPQSILTQLDLKPLLNRETISRLSDEAQQEIYTFLPLCDQIKLSGGKLGARESAFNNEFFTLGLSRWKEKLVKGEMTEEYQKKLHEKLDKQRKTIDPWKEKFFESTWGEKSTNERFERFLKQFSQNKATVDAKDPVGSPSRTHAPGLRVRLRRIGSIYRSEIADPQECSTAAQERAREGHDQLADKAEAAQPGSAKATKSSALAKLLKDEGSRIARRSPANLGSSRPVCMLDASSSSEALGPMEAARPVSPRRRRIKSSLKALMKAKVQSPSKAEPPNGVVSLSAPPQVGAEDFRRTHADPLPRQHGTRARREACLSLPLVTARVKSETPQ